MITIIEKMVEKNGVTPTTPLLNRQLKMDDVIECLAFSKRTHAAIRISNKAIRNTTAERAAISSG